MRLFTISLLTFLFSFCESHWWYLNQLNISKEIKNPNFICRFYFLKRKQRILCEKHFDSIYSIGEGLRKAISECQHQFYFSKWNCSTNERDATVFGKIFFKSGSKELSFFQAISIAGALYALTEECSAGKISKSCFCSTPSKPKDSYYAYAQVTQENDVFKWRGCQQSFDYSHRFLRDFLSAETKQSKKGKNKLAVHNYKAGEFVFKKFSLISCSCHGLSGSCSLKTCWKTLPSFRVIGKTLKKEYYEAIKVNFHPSGKLVPVFKNQRKPKKHNLIYFHETPDYCQKNSSKGNSQGTKDRLCNINSVDEDSCEILCCGHKYSSIKKSRSIRCECQFNWCCQITCKLCNQTLIESRCQS